MSKIVIDARIINSSTGRYVERLLHYLQKIDHDNEYIIITPSKDYNYWQPTNKNFKILSCDIKNYSIAEQTTFKNFLENLDADLVHFCMPQQPIFYKGKTVTTFHDLTLIRTYNIDKNWVVYHIKQYIGKWIFKKAAQKSTQIITPTNYTKNDLISFAKISADKITVTYEAADIKSKKAKPLKLPFKKFLLYVGKQSSYKNVRRLGDAHHKLLKKYPDLGLVLANPKDKAVLINEEYFKKNNYKNIYYPGRVDNKDLAWLYPNCACYVFPSFMEGFGLPGIEAMGLGAPVISSNATCLPEVYGDAALYFNPLDINDIVKKIDMVLSNNQLRSDLIKRGYKQFNKYSWRRMAEQTYQVYIKALNKKN